MDHYTKLLLYNITSMSLANKAAPVNNLTKRMENYMALILLPRDIIETRIIDKSKPPTTTITYSQS